MAKPEAQVSEMAFTSAEKASYAMLTPSGLNLFYLNTKVSIMLECQFGHHFYLTAASSFKTYNGLE